MPQYTTNAIYEYLKVRQHLEFNYLYIKDGNWLLIYGNEQAEPKLFLIASRLKEPLDGGITVFERTALALLSNQPVPVRILRFSESGFSKEISISSVTNERIEVIPTTELYGRLFEPYGLTADPNSKTKPVNDATSSTFHDWQRAFLSGRLKVSDVDVIVYGNDLSAIRIYELKRSYYSLADWKPYADDFQNFKLLRRAFDGNVPIYILYNKFSGNPRVEDISFLRVFKIVDDTPKINTVSRSVNGKTEWDFPIAALFK